MAIKIVIANQTVSMLHSWNVTYNEKMKKNNYITTTLILFVLIYSCTKSAKNEDVLDYFINPNLEKVNYRTFRNSNGSLPDIIFEQRISTHKSDRRNVTIDYVFRNVDSLILSGGTEKIENNKSEVLEQFIVLNNKKLSTSKIKNGVWVANSDALQSFTMEYYDKASDYKLIANPEAASRFKDTLGKQNFIIEFNTTMKTLVKGQEIQNIKSKSKRLYVKNKGLVYFDEFINGQLISYELME